MFPLWCWCVVIWNTQCKITWLCGQKSSHKSLHLCKTYLSTNEISQVLLVKFHTMTHGLKTFVFTHFEETDWVKTTGLDQKCHLSTRCLRNIICLSQKKLQTSWVVYETWKKPRKWGDFCIREKLRQAMRSKCFDDAGLLQRCGKIHLPLELVPFSSKCAKYHLVLMEFGPNPLCGRRQRHQLDTLHLPSTWVWMRQ